MKHAEFRKRSSFAVAFFGLLFWVAGCQNRPPSHTTWDAPQILNASGQRFRVVAIKGLSYPSSIAFLPDGTLLVSERGARTLRIVRNGVLDPKPITGLPEMLPGQGDRAGVDIALHPRFAENKLIYFTYWKTEPDDRNVATAVLGRGRFDGAYGLTDVRDLFVADAWNDGPAAARFTFGRDGKVYMVVGSPMVNSEPINENTPPGRFGSAFDGQDPKNHGGKALRLNDDGTVPLDNPFIGRPGFRSEIYALGIRNSLGLTIHPETGELWETEHGPQGGDEINIIKAGLNYGWPTISYGRAYAYDVTGKRSGVPPPDIQGPTAAPGMEQPFLFWVPAIAPGGIAFYTGD